MRVDLIGYSVRSLAEAISASGAEVDLAVDAFGDLDLLPHVRIWQPLRRSRAWKALLGRYPVLWTAPVENWPRFVARLDQAGINAGCTSEALVELRTWKTLGPKLRRAKVPFPRWTDEPPRETRGWLVKRQRSGGGLSIAFWSGKTPSSGRWYWQQYVRGLPMSALFTLDDIACRLVWLGEQWIGDPAAGPWSYRGNLGPVVPDTSVATFMERLARLLGQLEGAYGLVGVDGVWDGEKFWVIEINPRWTGAAELAMQWWHWPPIPVRRDASRHRPRRTDIAEFFDRIQKTGCLYAKRIVYAAGNGVVREVSPELRRPIRRDDCLVRVADLPGPGTAVRRGQPLCTVLGQGEDRRRLQAAVDWLAQHFAATQVSWCDELVPGEAPGP